MRKNLKRIAMVLLAVMMVTMLSACAGRTYNDGEFTGESVRIDRLTEDTRVEVPKGEIRVEVDVPVENTGSSNNSTEGEPNTETPGENAEDPSEENPDEDIPIDEDFDDRDYSTVCMSFNVLEWDTHYSGYSEPSVRAPWIVDTIDKYDPDLLGTQEVTKGGSSTGNFDMYQYLVDELTDEYDFRSLMDEKSKPGSTVAVNNLTIASGLLIFWKKDRFELKDSGAKVFSNDSGRHFQWAKLYDKQEDLTIVMTNTHYSINPGTDVAAGDALRLQQSNELYSFWDKNCPDGVPMYGTGDYNHNTNTTAYQSLNKGRFASTRDVSGKSNASSGVDYIYINGDVQSCYEYVRCNETYEPAGVAPADVNKRNVKYCPSDHYAIVAYCSNEYL